MGERYQLMAKDLASDLEKYAPDAILIVGTDDKRILKNCPNIQSFLHQQTGLLHCYNDKRFVMARGLKDYRTAIYIDADSRITGQLPADLEFPIPIIGPHENLLEHLEKYRPRDVEKIKILAQKIDVPIEEVQWVGEALFMLTRAGGQEDEFLKNWGLMANYLEMKGMHGGEGSILGLGAAQLGWQVQKTESWNQIANLFQHLDASASKPRPSWWASTQKRLGYHYRLNKTRLNALSDYDFYYR